MASFQHLLEAKLITEAEYEQRRNQLLDKLAVIDEDDDVTLQDGKYQDLFLLAAVSFDYR